MGGSNARKRKRHAAGRARGRGESAPRRLLEAAGAIDADDSDPALAARCGSGVEQALAGDGPVLELARRDALFPKDDELA